MPGGDIVVTGTLEGSLLVTRLSPEGDVRWSNTYGQLTAPSNARCNDGRPAQSPVRPGGMLVFRGQLVRLNDSGTVRWAHSYRVYTDRLTRGPCDHSSAAPWNCRTADTPSCGTSTRLVSSCAG